MGATAAAPRGGEQADDSRVDQAAPPLVSAAVRDRLARDALLGRIREARAQRTGTDAREARPATPPGPAAPRQRATVAEEEEDEISALPREYIRGRIQEDLIPVAQECYASALADDPKLGGKLVLEFTIMGEPDVGGVVDQVKVGPDSDLTHAALVECMQESMLAVSFDAPRDGGEVNVIYPFEFSPDSPPSP